MIIKATYKGFRQLDGYKKGKRYELIVDESRPTRVCKLDLSMGVSYDTVFDFLRDWSAISESTEKILLNLTRDSDGGLLALGQYKVTFATKEIRDDVESYAETNSRFNLPSKYDYTLEPEHKGPGYVCKIIASVEAFR